MDATLLSKPLEFVEIFDLFSRCFCVAICDSTSVSSISMEQMLQRTLNRQPCCVSV